MSDYTYPNNPPFTFGYRDTLAPGDTNKIIKGSDFDPEFLNLQTAVNSKLNILDPSFTGTMNGGTIFGGTY